ncbi:hypothetical protein GCM10007079_39180 [Nocardiopsis terrae]|uniref:DUF397 domain-containing protein n=1 Tax=Nocardiopsis terrae TaxID=372655 RepID=A0ABR9HET4_9ACTN|nr:DUF397 domain-containing protein [Nocardiopsis terrae]MBE1457305.1 hypothetical protein [Nocardiopsis terrae]GHC91653.1 hypothetical protein GCM10007079_39180 [Nocardiopsis terrae]
MSTNPSGWHKSSYSANGANCVEVAAASGHEVVVENKEAGDVVFVVRDSKNPEAAPLVFTRAEWDAFVEGVKDGEFDAERLLAALVG